MQIEQEKCKLQSFHILMHKFNKLNSHFRYQSIGLSFYEFQEDMAPTHISICLQNWRKKIMKDELFMHACLLSSLVMNFYHSTSF